MKRSELEHVITAAANITDDEIVVIGSQAILGQFPDAPPSLLRSMEADVYPRNNPERADESTTVTAWCIEAHDLALAKLAAGRPKDIDFVSEAIKAALIDSEQLRLGLELMPARLQAVVRERLEIAFANVTSA